MAAFAQPQFKTPRRSYCFKNLSPLIPRGGVPPVKDGTPEIPVGSEKYEISGRDNPASLRYSQKVRSTKRGHRIGVYAGSFDPPTVGHLWMIEQGVRLFDRFVVAVGINPDKKCAFSLEDRLQMLRDSTKQFPNLTLASFANQYLIHYARSIGATHILRGIRSTGDYEYERVMRNINGDLDAAICTVLLMPPRDISEVSSSMVKGLIGPRGWQKIVRPYVPPSVYRVLIRTTHGRSKPAKMA